MRRLIYIKLFSFFCDVFLGACSLLPFHREYFVKFTMGAFIRFLSALIIKHVTPFAVHRSVYI